MARKTPRKPFPVTDDVLDAPDGAVVDGFERHGDAWYPVPTEKEAAPGQAERARRAFEETSTELLGDLDFEPEPEIDDLQREIDQGYHSAHAASQRRGELAEGLETVATSLSAAGLPVELEHELHTLANALRADGRIRPDGVTEILLPIVHRRYGQPEGSSQDEETGRFVALTEKETVSSLRKENVPSWPPISLQKMPVSKDRRRNLPGTVRYPRKGVAARQLRRGDHDGEMFPLQASSHRKRLEE